MAFLKYYGHYYEVSVAAYFKVGMSRMNHESAINEAYQATDRIFDNKSDITVISSNVTGVKCMKFFDVAEVRVVLSVKNIRAHDYEKAYKDAESVIESVDLPAGVKLYEAQAYEYSMCGEAVGE